MNKMLIPIAASSGIDFSNGIRQYYEANKDRVDQHVNNLDAFYREHQR